jgi:hypothetical protein
MRTFLVSAISATAALAGLATLWVLDCEEMHFKRIMGRSFSSHLTSFDRWQISRLAQKPKWLVAASERLKRISDVPDAFLNASSNTGFLVRVMEPMATNPRETVGRRGAALLVLWLKTSDARWLYEWWTIHGSDLDPPADDIGVFESARFYRLVLGELGREFGGAEWRDSHCYLYKASAEDIRRVIDTYAGQCRQPRAQ